MHPVRKPRLDTPVEPRVARQVRVSPALAHSVQQQVFLATASHQPANAKVGSHVASRKFNVR